MISPTDDDATQTSRTPPSGSNTNSAVFRDVSFSSRKVKSENQSWSQKNKEQKPSVESKIEKSRLETSKHNITAEETKCQPQVAGASIKLLPVECKDLSPKRSPVAAAVDADHLSGEANIDGSNIGCEVAEVFQEIVPKKNSGAEVNIFGLLTKREVKMTGYCPSSFFCNFVLAHKHTKKTTRPISSHLDQATLVNKGFII